MDTADQRDVRGHHGLALYLLLAILAVWLLLGAVAIGHARLSGDSQGTVLAVFPPQFDRRDSLSAVIRADGLLVQETWFENVWVVHGGQSGFAGRLTDAGAWGVFRSGGFRPAIVKGCFL